MKKREVWLKLFSENDVALACAIHLTERYCQDTEALARNKDFIIKKITELDKEVSAKEVAKIFPD